MSRVIMAKIILRDVCDPDEPGSCSPVIQLEEASELENLVSEYGVIFEEPIQEQEAFENQPENEWEDLPVDEEPWEDRGGNGEPFQDPDEAPEPPEAPEPEGDGECPLEPDRPWDESVCGDIERRIVSRILGG